MYRYVNKNKTPDRRLKDVQNISISDKKATNYKIKQTQQVTVPSSEEIIASCNNIVLYQFPEANSTDIFVYIFTCYILILSCLYAVRQGNVLFKENGKEENALQLSNLSISILTHNLFESLYLFCPNCDIFPCIPYVN
jgi:hypothetical protein